MAESNGAVTQLKELGGRFSLMQKLSLAGAAVLVIAILGYAITAVNRPDYRPLFSGLSPDDAGRIATKLKDQKVTYQISDDNSTIYVPAEQANDLRIQLASEGLPQSSRIGFELFDQTSFGATEFSEQIKYQRALEGELERTIAAIAEVERVRVHIALPRESFFKDREEKAKASVTLKLKSNRRLAESSIAGIVHLVANSIQGLTPDQVSVVDTQGRMLARPGEQDGELKLSSSQLELRERMEKELGHRVLGMLEPVVGPGKVRVSVAADLDFSRNEKLEEKYDPDATAIRSEQTLEERETRDGKGVGGVAGTRANQPPGSDAAAPQVPAQPGDAPMPARAKTSQTTNFEVTRTTTRTVNPAGNVRRLSVAVIVDNSNKLVTEGEVTKPVSTKRSPEELDQIRQAVLGAIGLDEKRGDQLVVQNIPFDNPLEEPPPPPANTFKAMAQNPETLKTTLRYLVPLLLVFLAYLLIVRPILKRLSAAGAFSKRPAGAAQLPAGRTEALPTAEAEKNLLNAATPRTVRELEAELQLEPEVEVARMTKADIIKARLREKAQKEPEAMAQMVRSWLREEPVTNGD